MRNAASELRREDPKQASEQGQSALDKLRDLEKRLESSRPDDPRRMSGELELQARQLAEGQRQVAAEVGKLGQTNSDKQATQWLATEQEQIATRLRTLQESLKQAGVARPDGKPRDKAAQAAAKAAQAAADAARGLEKQRLAERMQKSADDLRSASDPRSQAPNEEDFARALESAADTLAAGGSGRDGDSQKLANELAKTRQMRERMDKLTRELDDLNRQNEKSGQGNNTQNKPGNEGKSGQGQNGNGGTPADIGRLRQELARQLQQTQELMDELRRQDPSFFSGGDAGLTSTGQGMALSAPGTEAFKQDFAKWDQLRTQATHLLEVAESGLSARLQARDAHDRLAAGIEDKSPAAYQKQVDNYFKALATAKKK
jgi:hypothetical protein